MSLPFCGRQKGEKGPISSSWHSGYGSSFGGASATFVGAEPADAELSVEVTRSESPVPLKVVEATVAPVETVDGAFDVPDVMEAILEVCKAVDEANTGHTVSRYLGTTGNM